MPSTSRERTDTEPVAQVRQIWPPASMPYAITLTLDDRGADRVRKLWRSIDESGLAKSTANLKYAPHVTLTRHGDLDTLATSDLLESFAAGLPALTLRIDRLAAFERPAPVLFLGIHDNTELKAFHARLASLVAATKPDEQTKPDQWVPHVTLTAGMPAGRKRGELEALVAKLFQPFDARLDHLDLVRFPPVAIVNSIALGGRHAVNHVH